VRDALLAALDDWAVAAQDPQRRAWVLEVARRADPDPWRDGIRDPALWDDAAALARRASGEQAAEQPPRLLAALGERLVGLGGNAEGLLRKAQRRHPGDFWISALLGTVLLRGDKPAEGVGYLRAALALRPDISTAHNNLAMALHDVGQREEAVAEYRRAIELQPRDAKPHYNLGITLRAEGKMDEAIAEYRKAIELDPAFIQAHNNLGTALGDQGKADEAVAEYRRAIELDSRFAPAHYNLGRVLRVRGKLDEAAAEYRRAVDLDPRVAPYHVNLGIVLQAQGNVGEAIAEYRRAIKLNPRLALAHHALGDALREQGRPAEAAAEYRKAIELDPRSARARFHLGIALAMQGKQPEANAEYKKAIEQDGTFAEPHGALGAAYLAQGQYAEAVEASRRCLELLPANHPMRGHALGQLRHCEAMLALDRKRAAILKGEAQPADAAEQAALARLCAAKKQFAAAARFYAGAFADRPALADDRRTQDRYNAACAAALAAAGEGENDAKLDDQERAPLRRQALGWLRDDLALWGKLVEDGTPQTRAAAQKALRHWQEDADLAGVRDLAALAKVPEAERAEWHKLWADVEALRKKAAEGGQR
jgi:tetratricopeptide (TPR) repeat protein